MLIRKPSNDFSRTIFCCTWEQMRDWRSLPKRIEHACMYMYKDPEDKMIHYYWRAHAHDLVVWIIFCFCAVRLQLGE